MYAFGAACSWYWLPTLGSEKLLQEGGNSGDWNLKHKCLHFHTINLFITYIGPNIKPYCFIKTNLNICVNSIYPFSWKIEVDLNLMPPSDVLFIIATRIRVKVKVVIIQKGSLWKDFLNQTYHQKRKDPKVAKCHTILGAQAWNILSAFFLHNTSLYG